MQPTESKDQQLLHSALTCRPERLTDDTSPSVTSCVVNETTSAASVRTITNSTHRTPLRIQATRTRLSARSALATPRPNTTSRALSEDWSTEEHHHSGRERAPTSTDVHHMQRRHTARHEPSHRADTVRILLTASPSRSPTENPSTCSVQTKHSSVSQSTTRTSTQVLSNTGHRS